VDFENVQWEGYNNFCITGGEPLLRMDLVEKVCRRLPKGKTVILYTNGLLLTPLNAKHIESLGVQYVNVGLHIPTSFKQLIPSVLEATRETKLGVRFHAQDIYKDWLTSEFPGVSFRFWKMNNCDRENEDRIVLKETP